MCQNMAIMGFLILYGGLYMNISLTDIHTSGPAIVILYQWYIINAKFSCPKSLQTINYSSKVTTPQDAHGRLVLQVYFGSSTLEFSAIRR